MESPHPWISTYNLQSCYPSRGEKPTYGVKVQRLEWAKCMDRGMTDLVSTYMIIKPGFAPLILPFPLCLAAVSDCDFRVIPSWVYPSRSSPTWSFFRSHSNSLSLAPSLPPISVACKNLSSGFLALSLANNSVRHLRSAWACHLTRSVYSSLIIFLLSFLHLRHLVYKCSIDSPYYKYSGVSITPILATCPMLKNPRVG